MESRSQHRSQDMGAPQPPGPRTTGVILVESRVETADQGIFAGIDTTLVGLTDGLPPEVAGRAYLMGLAFGFGWTPCVYRGGAR